MKGRLAIIVTVVIMVVVLVALNAASYVRVEQAADTEAEPDRSTFNSGATGTRALYEYLRQTNHEVTRWRRPAASLPASGYVREAWAQDDAEPSPSTFVVVGRLRRVFERRDAEALLHWVERGGRLVVVDRSPDSALLQAHDRWRVGSEVSEVPDRSVRADDAEAMTRGVELVRPAQPSALTLGVEAVSRSRFAGRLRIYQVEPAAPVAIGYRAGPGGGGGSGGGGGIVPAQTPTPADENPWDEGEENAPPPPPPAPAPKPATGAPATQPANTPATQSADSPAPVAHLGEGRADPDSILADYAYGRGRVVVLSDPYIVSNAGVNRADNLFLAVNVVTGGLARGRIAFDEYHQGYGDGRNEALAYFRGTPVLWLFAQAALVALALVWTRGRRFARPLPAPREDRRSKLEFVASMAELQQRARAYDLALENVYTRTRRALARYGGLPPTARPEQIAERVAARSGKERGALESLLRECEDACAGSPLSARRALELARALRELERDLGILMRSREIRQRQ
jgi:Domain of unknown function (DUF4350)